MRLLGIITALFALCYPHQVSSQSQSQACNSIVTKDLLACASDKLKKADAHLNSNYRKALALLPAKKPTLKEAQISWLSFRDEYCQDIYTETLPGNEADIERTLCLALLTSDRAAEIERLYTSSQDREFYRAVSALERAGYDRAELMGKLKNSASQDQKWSRYVSQNCELQGQVKKENEDNCKARTNFNRSY
ncbi:lysozyme inhibitor LprI family protein [Lysobacter cavernae]|uniref:Lysozyme inhibitor LprI family protein n=1 Tax=Lysobacter cavernae TaxID=1685901 RepID=A0ABV7RT73_9GAMM